MAISVWKCFGAMFCIPSHFQSITQAMVCRMALVNTASQYSISRIGVATYIFREIWVARCRTTFEGERMSARAICLKFIYHVQLLTMVHAPQRAFSTLQFTVLNLLGVSQCSVRTKRSKWVKWDKPSPKWFKLNIDGSARAGIIIGGGVVRNFECNIIAGFSNYYGACSNNLAELLALRDGLILCKQLQLSPIIVESDSMLVVGSVRLGRNLIWRLTYSF